MFKLRIIGVFLLFPITTLFARKITFEDLYGVPFCGAPQVSPDGKRIVFELHTSDPRLNQEQDHLWIMNSDGTGIRQITSGLSSEWHPRWTPDGRLLLFLSDREEGAQVWQLPLEAGDSRRLTSFPTEVSDFACFPENGGLLLVTRVFPDCESDSCNKTNIDIANNSADAPRLYDQLLFRHYFRWDDGRLNRMYIAYRNDSTVTPVFLNKFDTPTALLGGYGDFDISSDGEIAFAMSADSIPAIRVNNNIYTINPGSAPIRLTNGSGLETTPRYSPDGRFISYLSAARAGYESDQRDLMLIDRRSNKHINLTEKFDRSIAEYIWDTKGQDIYFTAIDRGFIKIWRVSVKNGKIELILGDAVYGDLSISPDSRYLVMNRSLSDQPYELYRYDIGSRRLTRLTHFTETILSKLEMNRAQEFWFEGSFGDSIHGFLTEPPDLDSRVKYPLVLLIHGGPQWSWLGDFNYYGWNTQLLAAQGYLVAQIDPHGSAGYGKDFQDYVSGSWGMGDYDDLMMGIDYLILNYPSIDSTRMAALGRSYGGFMTNWICGHNDRFKCLITIDGTFNQISGYGSTDELWFPEWEFKGTPWTNYEEYVRSSPATYAANFKTPTLIIHGQRDFRVDLSEGLQMFTTLQRLGVPSEFLYFPISGHNVSGLENLQIVYEKQFEWLEHWLKK